MELSLKKPQRKVTYFGVELIIPNDATFLSMDDDGVVTAHSDRPWEEPGFFEGYELGEVAVLDMPDDLSSHDTLREYKLSEG